MAKKTTAAERKAFIEEQRAHPRGYGANRVLPHDMSFIDKQGNIVRPNKEDYEAQKAKRDAYNSSRRGRYQAPQEPMRYHGRERQRRGYEGVIAVFGLLAGIFFLSSNITGNTIAGMTTKTASWIGAVLILIGIFVGYFWLKNRNKKERKEKEEKKKQEG